MTAGSNPRPASAHETDVLVIGAGIVGISIAYAIKTRAPATRVTLLDSGAPMAWTSAQSGENYRNWWPQPVMKRFIEHSIGLMEAQASQSGGRITLTRSGYALATRAADIEPLLTQLSATHGDGGADGLRIHERDSGSTYAFEGATDRLGAASGVDVLRDAALIRRSFPTFNPSITTIFHVRRGCLHRGSDVRLRHHGRLRRGRPDGTLGAGRELAGLRRAPVIAALRRRCVDGDAARPRQPGSALIAPGMLSRQRPATRSPGPHSPASAPRPRSAPRHRSSCRAARAPAASRC